MLNKSLLNKCPSGVCSLQQWYSNFKVPQSPRVLINCADLAALPTSEDPIWWVWGGQEPVAGQETLGNTPGETAQDTGPQQGPECGA